MEMVELVTRRSRAIAASLLLCPPSSWPPPHPPLPDSLPHARLDHPCSSSSCGAEEEGVGNDQEEGCVLAPGDEGCDRPGSRPRQRYHGCMLVTAYHRRCLDPRSPPPLPWPPARCRRCYASRSPPPWPPARRHRRGLSLTAAASSAPASRRGAAPPPHARDRHRRTVPRRGLPPPLAPSPCWGPPPLPLAPFPRRVCHAAFLSHRVSGDIF
jgi:hypothetical protein